MHSKTGSKPLENKGLENCMHCIHSIPTPLLFGYLLLLRARIHTYIGQNRYSTRPDCTWRSRPNHSPKPGFERAPLRPDHEQIGFKGIHRTGLLPQGGVGHPHSVTVVSPRQGEADGRGGRRCRRNANNAALPALSRRMTTHLHVRGWTGILVPIIGVCVIGRDDRVCMHGCFRIHAA